jgi:RHS repeat-associated protein
MPARPLCFRTQQRSESDQQANWGERGDAGALQLAAYNSSTTYFKHYDWLGTVRAWSNVSGASVGTCTNLPFGDGQTCTGTSPTPWHYTGQPLDSESNLEHFLFRQDSTTQGRWTSPDPAGLAAVSPANPQSWNRYAYVDDNPINGLDLSGLCDLVIGGFMQSPNSPDTSVQTAFANWDSANLAFPFSGETVRQSLLSSYGPLSAAVVTNAVTNTVQQSLASGATTNLLVYSGGAGELGSIWQSLPNNIQSNISSITYVSPGDTPGGFNPPGISPPGAAGAINTFGGTVSVFTGSGPLDNLGRL